MIANNLTAFFIFYITFINEYLKKKIMTTFRTQTSRPVPIIIPENINIASKKFTSIRNLLKNGTIVISYFTGVKYLLKNISPIS